MQTAAEHFDWHRRNSNLLRVWFKEMPWDACCEYMYVIDVIINRGDLLGLILNDKDDCDGAEFYRLEDLRNWAYLESDQPTEE